MTGQTPTVTYLELRASTAEGEAGAGLSHTGGGLVLLHVQELAAAGEPRGALTLVHDAGEHGGVYLDAARDLAAAGWSVAVPDLRGHGRSEGARGHSAGIAEVLRDLGEVQDHLAYRQPEARRVLAGQGLGALYCLAFACERPEGVAGIVLSAPLLAPAFREPKPAGGLMGLFRRPRPETPGSIGTSPAGIGADPLVHDVITLRAIEQAREAAARYGPRMESLPMPALVLRGGEDAPSLRVAAGDLARVKAWLERLSA